MSITYGFFNSVHGDRRYNAEQMSAIFNGIITDGVFMNIGTALGVRATTGFVVTVGIGRVWFNSTWLLNDAIYPITMDPAEVLLDRIDMIIVEINRNNSVRAGSIKMVKGTPASSPQAPELVNTEYVHQYPLAYIRIIAGATNILQANITNAVGTSACPYVTGILQTVNIDNLVAQWQDEWYNWTTEQKADFIEWTDSLKDILDEDPATSLAEKIYKTNHVVLVTLLASDWAGTSAPYTQTVFVNDATEDAQALVVNALADGATPAVQLAYSKAFAIITGGTASLGEKSATFKVYKKPVTDITIGLKGIFVNQYEPFRVLSGDTNGNIFKVTIL